MFIFIFVDRFLTRNRTKWISAPKISSITTENLSRVKFAWSTHNSTIKRKKNMANILYEIFNWFVFLVSVPVKNIQIMITVVYFIFMILEIPA